MRQNQIFASLRQELNLLHIAKLFGFFIKRPSIYFEDKRPHKVADLLFSFGWL